MKRNLVPIGGRYGLAVVAVATSLALTHWLWPGSDPGLSPLFYAAVVIAAWYGGVGPGLLATVLAGFFSALFVMEEKVSFAVQMDDVLRVGVFVLVCAVLNSLQAMNRRAATRLAQAKLEAEQARDAAESARAEAEKANRSKDRFLAAVTHELRNPLNPVRLSLDYWCGRPLDRELAEDLKMIQHNVELECRLIGDLLELSRIRNGKLSLNCAPTSVAAVLRSALSICEPDARSKGIATVTHFAAADPWVHGDAARLQQILWNLLNNAVKFTPAGGSIFVSTRVEPDASLCIEVRDTGPGIAPDLLPRIFEAFEQGADGQRLGGLGLGLAISQSLARAHNGRIQVHSDGKDRGATFNVYLPTIPAPQGEHSSPPPAAEPAPVPHTEPQHA